MLNDASNFTCSTIYKRDGGYEYSTLDVHWAALTYFAFSRAFEDISQPIFCLMKRLNLHLVTLIQTFGDSIDCDGINICSFMKLHAQRFSLIKTK